MIIFYRQFEGFLPVMLLGRLPIPLVMLTLFCWRFFYSWLMRKAVLAVVACECPTALLLYVLLREDWVARDALVVLVIFYFGFFFSFEMTRFDFLL